nr:membrane protein of ER body-like protein isoform X2 [Ipomoea batatas]
MLVWGSKYNIEREISKEVSNCHSEKNGYANLPSVTENGGQESTFDGDQEGAEEHVDPTPADTAEIKDCLPRLENCVYFDKDEGESVKQYSNMLSFSLISAMFLLVFNVYSCKMPKGQLHILLDYKTLDQCGLYFSFDSEDGKLTSSSSSVEESNKRNPGDVCIEGSLLSDLQYHGNLKDENLSNFNILPTETLPQEPRTVHKLSTVEEIESADVDRITDSEIDAKDYDVENVLRKQNTHDLYCPNCHSCITRRVILRKRKRKVRISSEDVKRNKLETANESKSYVSPTQLSSDHDEPLISLDDTPISAASGYHRDREPEIFRCLSCFSFFIPTGSGFKLFQIFGEKGDKENKRDEQGVRMSKSWFSSIFASDKGSADQGKDHKLYVGKNNNEVILPSSNLCDKSDQSLSIQETIPPVHVDSRSIDPHETEANISTSQNELERAGKIINDAIDISVCAIMGKKGDPVNHFEVDTSHQLNLSNGIEENGAIYESLTPANKTQVSSERFVESTLSASQTGLKILITSNEESMTLEKKQADKICDSPDDEAEVALTSPVFVLKGSEGETKLDISTDFPQQHIGAVLLSEPPVEDKDAMFQTGTKGEDTIISVVEAGPTETAESMNLPNLATEMCAVEQQGTNAREGNKIEIIKSIVYGGLAESITSLSILWELKKDCPEQASNQIMEQGDRYGKLLGHRENFVIHAIVIMLSYAVFALVPPTVYGFSFRKSDDMELKLIAAAAASLLCIIVLATGKVYAQRPPKSYLKTITFYVVLGFLVSGVSFAAGQLINRLLLKLGLFQSSSEVNLFQPGVTQAHAAAWVSY